jgi:hypothetical protein
VKSSLSIACTALALLAPLSARAADAASPDAQKLEETIEAQQADLNAQEARIQALEKKIEGMEKGRAPVASPPKDAPAAPAASASASPSSTDPTKGLVLSGYAQGQYERHQDSEDQVRPGGVPMNQDRFLVRRARLKLEREWQFASVMFEVDGNTVNGAAASFHHVEPSLLYRGDNPTSMPPLVKATLGLFDVPFSAELVESPRTRFFMERSVASRAFFPSEPDLGLRVSGALGWLRYAVALTNGEPAGEKNGFALRDPNAAKDLVVRVGGVADPAPGTKIQFGASVLKGKGFSRGTDPTKSSVVWRDFNENGQIDNGELVSVVGTAGTPSQSFDRWAIGADMRIEVQTKQGMLSLFGEVTFASNLDRGLYVADPVATGLDAREIGYVVGFQQEIGKYAVFGFRTDYYDPNADLFDRQAGKLVPYRQTIRTISPMAAFVLPGRARVIVQYDVSRNSMGRTDAGVPTNLAMNALTLRLQGEL